MSKPNGNVEELRPIHAAALQALELLDQVACAVKAKVRAQGTAVWLKQKIDQAKDKVKVVCDGIVGIEKNPAKPVTPEVKPK